jgi:hypothetical protein
VDGSGPIWKYCDDRFFCGCQGAVIIGINDFGATPRMVALDLAP